METGVEDLVKKIDTNIERIDRNAKRIEENFERIQQNSCSLEILKDYSENNKILAKDNKRLFIIIIIVISLWALTTAYLVFVLSDTGTTTSTIDIDGVEEIDNSHIKIGDDIWEKSE